MQLLLVFLEKPHIKSSELGSSGELRIANIVSGIIDFSNNQVKIQNLFIGRQ